MSEYLICSLLRLQPTRRRQARPKEFHGLITERNQNKTTNILLILK